MFFWVGAGLTLTLILTIKFKAVNPVNITYLMNFVIMVTVMEEVTNGKVIRLLYDFQGHTVHFIINFRSIPIIFCRR